MDSEILVLAFWRKMFGLGQLVEYFVAYFENSSPKFFSPYRGALYWTYQNERILYMNKLTFKVIKDNSSPSADILWRVKT